MNDEATNRAIDTVVKRLADSSSLLFITGAGVSADSGLPTYRGIGGLYNVEHPEEGIPIEEILSGHMMRRRPELTWKRLSSLVDVKISLGAAAALDAIWQRLS